MFINIHHNCLPTIYITSLKHLHVLFYRLQLEIETRTKPLYYHYFNRTAVVWLHVTMFNGCLIFVMAFVFSPVAKGIPCRQFNQVENGQFNLFMILQHHILFVLLIVA